jgi:beta-1,4-mannooligosaccharide/beta-1,4-mannosyl-N-acetylglucosamine phosphorylase
MTLKRYLNNPVLSREDLPELPPRLVDASSVFNPGAVRHDGRTRLLLRVQTRGRESLLLQAVSDEGLRFQVLPEIVELHGLERVSGTVLHVYDPRITALEGRYYITLALDTAAGGRLALARTDDFRRFEFLGLLGKENARNGVLFPERVGGRYLLLSRPNTVRPPGGGALTGDRIVLSASDDLERWRRIGEVMSGRPHFWDELIGAGPPPLKTREGWLLVYHGVATHFAGAPVYQAGAALLDLDDPLRVLARTRDNILEPRETYELVGQVPNVVFPSGLVTDRADAAGFAPLDSRAWLYYGAADSVVALATATVADLLAACRA